MAGAIVQFVENDQTAAGGQVTWDAPALTPTAGNELIAVLWYTYSGASALTFTLSDTSGGNDTWTEIFNSSDAGAKTGLVAYILTGAAATSTVVRFTGSANDVRYPAAAVFEVSGVTGTVVGSAAQRQSAPGTGTDGVTSGNTSTLTAQPAFIIGITQNENTDSTPAVGTGYTNIGTGWDYDIAPGGRFEHKRVTSTSAVAATFTAGTNVAHYTGVIALEESAVAAGGQPTMARHSGTPGMSKGASFGRGW